MQTTKFRIKGSNVQLLLAGVGPGTTARVIANLLIAQYGDALSDMISAEISAKSRKLPADADFHWPGYDLGLDLRVHIPLLGWTAPPPRYEDQSGSGDVKLAED